MKKRTFILFILTIFIINFISAGPINDTLHLNIQTVNSSDDIVTGTFHFEFNISTTEDCANIVYTNFTNLTTDSRGIISYYLENTNLNYSDQYWLCYYRDGTLINASKIARNPYTFRARNITLSGIEVDSNFNMGIYNLTIGDKITFALGELIDNLVDGWIKINGGLNVSENLTVSGYVGIGTATPGGLLNLHTTGSGTTYMLNISDSGGTLLEAGKSSGDDSFMDMYDDAGNRDIRLHTNSNSWFNGGNIGIGTSSPNVDLHIDKPAVGSSAYLQLTTDGTGNTANDGMVIGIAADENMYIMNRENTHLYFRTNDSNRMTILNDGKVGIGTSSPETTFHIVPADGTYFTEGLKVERGNVATQYGILNAMDGYMDLIATIEGGTTYGGFDFRASNDGSTSVSRLYINSNGKVGINTTSPTHTLNVVGDVNVTENITIAGCIIFSTGGQICGT